MSSNREHFTTHGFHMNSKGKLWITNKWVSIILSILSRLQIMPATPLPWIKGSDNSYVEHENKKESEVEGRNTPKEEEIVNYRVLKLKKTSDQRKSLSKEEIYYSASDLKVLNEDNEEVKDINESIGLSLLETSDQGNSLAKEKENFSVSELEVTFPTRIVKDSRTAIDKIYIHKTRNYTINPVINGLSDHDCNVLWFDFLGKFNS